MSSHHIIFDIETAPLPASYLDLICPEFSPPSNYKDKDKIEANLAEQKQKWMERAALSPMTGKVLCIGYIDLDGTKVVLDGGGDEATLLKQWTDLVSLYKNEEWVGFNIFSFDLPFLMKRAWSLGVKPCLRPGTRLHYLEHWTDLRDIWQMGDRQAEGSLDSIGKFFGIGAKNGSAKDFHVLWETDREAAVAYLHNDLSLTHAIGQKMGVIP